MKIKVWATFIVSGFLMFFFSYALIAQGKKVYTQKNQAVQFIMLHAQSAYISHNYGSTEYHLTLTSVSKHVLGYKQEGSEHYLSIPVEKWINEIHDKEISIVLTYYGSEGDGYGIELRAPMYDPYKEEVTFVIPYTSIPLNERLPEPVLLYQTSIVV